MLPNGVSDINVTRASSSLDSGWRTKSAELPVESAKHTIKVRSTCLGCHEGDNKQVQRDFLDIPHRVVVVCLGSCVGFLNLEVGIISGDLPAIVTLDLMKPKNDEEKSN